MVWTPENLSEQEEANLISMCAELDRQMGSDKFQELVDNLMLSSADVIERETGEDHPARIRLNEVRHRREFGFD